VVADNQSSEHQGRISKDGFFTFGTKLILPRCTNLREPDAASC
jgi:hypothetical protein